MDKSHPEHTDLMGEPLHIGDVVITSYTGTTIQLAKVEKFHPVMITLISYRDRGWRGKFRRYPHETLKVSKEKVVEFLLREGV